jgi:hypothetical protein
LEEKKRKRNEKKASLQNRQICCWLKYNKGIVRYIEKNRQRARDGKKRKQNKYVYQQIKKTNQNDKAFIHHIYAQGKGAHAHLCVLMRDRVLDVYIYIEEKTKKPLYKSSVKYAR